jgi:hypothetical protein
MVPEGDLLQNVPSSQGFILLDKKKKIKTEASACKTVLCSCCRTQPIPRHIFALNICYLFHLK